MASHVFSSSVSLSSYHHCRRYICTNFFIFAKGNLLAHSKDQSSIGCKALLCCSFIWGKKLVCRDDRSRVRECVIDIYLQGKK